MLSQRLREKIDRLLSREKGTIYKDPGGRINICLVYPDTYHIGMSNLGFQGIYTLLNRRADVVCERAFLPDDEEMSEYIRTGTEMVSLESKRPLNRFDIIAFSVSFENDYPNIPLILRLSRIPFLRKVRREGVYPLLIMGGICAFFNPEPLSEVFDICFIGEGEEMLEEFLDLYKVSKDREGLFREAMKIEGLYLPEFYEITYDNKGVHRRALSGAPEVIKRRRVKDINNPAFRASIITPDAEFSDMCLVEVMRGCPWSCRFCVTGFVYKPVRKKDLTHIIEDIRSLPEAKRYGLIGPSLTDYPDIKEVLNLEGVEFSITSLRAGKKSAEIIGLLRGVKSVSIAPEAGTERLRKVINKRITEDDILESSSLLLSEGIENLRLYFMIGLPTERDEDIDGIVDLVRRIRESNTGGNIILTISTFVPKPFTPFQWHPMEAIETVKERLKTIKKGLKNLRGVKVFHDVPKYAYMQGLFARGDRRIGMVLEGMLYTRDWKRASLEKGIDVEDYLFRQRERDEEFPWDFIDNGITKEQLWKEYMEAMTLSS